MPPVDRDLLARFSVRRYWISVGVGSAQKSYYISPKCDVSAMAVVLHAKRAISLSISRECDRPSHGLPASTSNDWQRTTRCFAQSDPPMASPPHPPRALHLRNRQFSTPKTASRSNRLRHLSECDVVTTGNEVLGIDGSFEIEGTLSFVASTKSLRGRRKLTVAQLVQRIRKCYGDGVMVAGSCTEIRGRWSSRARREVSGGEADLMAWCRRRSVAMSASSWATEIWGCSGRCD